MCILTYQSIVSISTYPDSFLKKLLIAEKKFKPARHGGGTPLIPVSNFLDNHNYTEKLCSEQKLKKKKRKERKKNLSKQK